ncbi:hypothetical protein Ahy_B05g075719 [Arachis hypogaea]|uniref:Protein FAR1-RELATED SEQUENCE n=1 Tax=Arachis hypogaea TaxID=3818 RepID=A0A444Z1U9_ARAHY|nr:hypothetical protein Ahy_B05g075719 [Arachis hypogaea]
MKEKKQNFFYELELEVDHSIKNAFRADARSKIACEYFKDVVSFDITYNTNSIIWFLVPLLVRITMLRCMGGKALKGILIDQCASIQRAIETCMLTTIYSMVLETINGFQSFLKIVIYGFQFSLITTFGLGRLETHKKVRACVLFFNKFIMCSSSLI